MKKEYQKKVTMYRVLLLVLTIFCCVLYSNDLIDYAILISLFIFFFGIFTMSDVEITSQNVILRKNYFWGLVGLKWTIEFDSITSLDTKEYDFETHEDAWMFTENLFSFLAVDFFKPKIKWLNTTLSHVEKGIEKVIELKLDKDDYWEIERRIKPRVPYNAQFGDQNYTLLQKGRKEISDFWIGEFENADVYFDFIGENPDYYQDERDIDEKYISKFAESQTENWIDHDFMESGFENGDESFYEKFKKYSYSDQWLAEVLSRAKDAGLKEVNTIVFVSKGKVKKPVSVSGRNFSLKYIGQIKYNV